MSLRFHVAVVLSAALLASYGGCAWLRRPIISGPTPPPITAQPTLDELIAKVHENTGRVKSLDTNRATLSVAGYPSLRTDFAYQQPGRLRLRATMLGATEVDLGSNDELFWFWIKRNSPSAVYFARHEEVARAPQQAIPIEPRWLVEALGLVEFDPSHRHSGPFVRRGGRLEIRTAIPGPTGDRTKITILDGRFGWVLEQHLYDANRQRLATAIASGYAYDPVSQTSMPKQVKIQWPAAAMSITLTLNELRINQLADGSNQLWTIPELRGTPYVNLTQQAQPAPGRPVQPAGQGRAALAPARSGFRAGHRGRY